jgi:hypothetical protein
MTIATAGHVLVDFGGDGLLLDLSSGSLFHLNEAAAFVWTGVLGGADAAAVSATLASRYRIPLATAREHVSDALKLDGDRPDVPAPTDPFLYERNAAGYLLSRDGTPLLLVEAQGRSIRLADGRALGARELPLMLQSVAPKVMSLRGHFVLHASAAVAVDGTTVAFSGRSGAGKTTAARALAKAGARLLSEDKLVLRQGATGVEVLAGGERRIMEWVAAAAPELAAGRSAPCDDLDRAAEGDALPLRQIGFLDAARRSGGSFLASALGAAQAARALFSNSFHGSDQAGDWTRHLQIAAAAARRLAAYDLTAPAGTAALESAAREVARSGRLSQTAMTAS